MSAPNPMTELPDLRLEVLAYLVEHPRAQDTRDGILEWWLLHREIQWKRLRLQHALDQLVAEGMLVTREVAGHGTNYGLAPERLEEARRRCREVEF